MDVDKKSSIQFQYFGILCFLLMALSSLAWFGFTAADTAQDLKNLPSNISFDKGVFYMLGVGVCLGGLLIAMIAEAWAKKPPSDKVTRIATRIAIFGVVLMFVLPQLVHYALADYLEERGYSVCNGASYQWLAYQDIVYVNNEDTCLALILEKKNRWK